VSALPLLLLPLLLLRPHRKDMTLLLLQCAVCYSAGPKKVCSQGEGRVCFLTPPPGMKRA
jgi:hypothetical protein